MIIDYSQPYSPSGLACPVEGDYVLVQWEAPLHRPVGIKPWRVRRFAQLESSIYGDVVKFKGPYFDLPKARIVRVMAWDGNMPPGIKSW